MRRFSCVSVCSCVGVVVNSRCKVVSVHSQSKKTEGCKKVESAAWHVTA